MAISAMKEFHHGMRVLGLLYLSTERTSQRHLIQAPLKEQRQKAIRSLVRSEFFQLFDIHGSPAPYLMRTCSGTAEMVGRKAVGFQIEAIDGQRLDLGWVIVGNGRPSFLTPCQKLIHVKDTANYGWEKKVAVSDKPYTRRGVLSTVNSLFDPLGFAAPVTIKGRALLREFTTEVHEWDTELPGDKRNKWETWKKSLQDLSSLHLPRAYMQRTSLSNATYTELYLFSDASNWAIGAVAYLRAITADGQCSVGFVLGKAKLAPQPEPTIPRNLELSKRLM
ncbi:hypothetical protein L3Q82_005948 [Scortum barcoo]|uniref:Uncharacterized protein n=1 Tax=Scortum barcoo TaxID=214431 RepID=A0ACB8X2K8_9TELE|nr:hypothetical protein L3Q82_005948 [Scortum barcoo]